MQGYYLVQSLRFRLQLTTAGELDKSLVTSAYLPIRLSIRESKSFPPMDNTYLGLRHRILSFACFLVACNQRNTYENLAPDYLFITYDLYVFLF